MQNQKKDKELTQPYLLALTADGGVAVPVQTFLILDYQKVDIGGNITKALETLFMCYYAFDARYPDSLTNVYQFLQLLFGLKKRGSTGSGNATAQSVYISLKHKMDFHFREKMSV